MIRRIPVLALIVFVAAFAYGCEKKGPAEKAGEKIDHAISDAKDKAEEAGEAIEDAGKKIEDAVEEAEEAVKGD